MLRSRAFLAVFLALLAAPAWAAQDSAGEQTRDWSKIDTDGDNLISAEEMQKFLEQTWARQGNQESVAEQDKKEQ